MDHTEHTITPPHCGSYMSHNASTSLFLCILTIWVRCFYKKREFPLEIITRTVAALMIFMWASLLLIPIRTFKVYEDTPTLSELFLVNQIGLFFDKTWYYPTPVEYDECVILDDLISPAAYHISNNLIGLFLASIFPIVVVQTVNYETKSLLEKLCVFAGCQGIIVGLMITGTYRTINKIKTLKDELRQEFSGLGRVIIVHHGAEYHEWDRYFFALAVTVMFLLGTSLVHEIVVWVREKKSDTDKNDIDEALREPLQTKNDTTT